MYVTKEQNAWLEALQLAAKLDRRLYAQGWEHCHVARTRLV